MMSGISLENRLEIYELIAEYSHHVDNNRGEQWAAMFTPEGCLVGGGIEIRGTEGFLKQSRWLARSKTEYRHSITNIYLESDADNEKAVANAYCLVSDWATVPAEVALFVEYRFSVVRQSGSWKIAEVQVNMPYNEF